MLKMRDLPIGATFSKTRGDEISVFRKTSNLGEIFYFLNAEIIKDGTETYTKGEKVWTSQDEEVTPL